MNSFFCYSSNLLGSKSYAVQLEKLTSRQFRDKGGQDSQSYFYFPLWQNAKWSKFKQEFGEGPSPIDKIESMNKLDYTLI